MQENNRPLLSIRGLRTTFFTRRGRVNAVDGIDISIPAGKTIGLVGESGCGKSMTAMSVMGLIQSSGRVTDGAITFGDTDLLSLSRRQLRRITGDRIAMIFQEPMTSLNPVETVGKQVREAVLLHEHVSKEDAKERVLEIFRQVGIPEPERRYQSYPHQLSGGLRQRVMIGMAMVCSPDLLIADEPTTALDVTIEAQILRLMKTLQREKHTSILMITHNLGVVAEICDMVYVMYAGRIMEAVDVYELFKNPGHPYTKGLIHSLPANNIGDEYLFNIPGMVPNMLKVPAGCRFSPRCENACDRCRMNEPDLYDAGGGHLVRCFRFEKEGME